MAPIKAGLRPTVFLPSGNYPLRTDRGTTAVAVHAMILCAGLGTRLRPLTDERPKPLVPLDDRPLVSHAMELLATHGVRHLVANAYHLADQIDPALQPWAAHLGIDLRVLTESTLLGTAGGIRNALPFLGDEFVVYNGDVLAAPDLSRALSVHRATGAKVTMILRDDPDAVRRGVIEVTPGHRVVRILDEGPVPVAPVQRCMFTGVYVVSSAVAGDLPETGCVVRHTLRRLLARGERVSAVVDNGPWFDLGTVRSYAEAHFAVLRGDLTLHGSPPRPGPRIGPGATVAPTVSLATEVCVGRDARVSGSGRLERVIVWDGAEAVAPCANTVFSQRYRVEIPVG